MCILQEARSAGITLTTVGIGANIDGPELEQITNNSKYNLFATFSVVDDYIDVLQGRLSNAQCILLFGCS